MDVRDYLKEQGLTPEEVDALVGNAKAFKAMQGAFEKYTEGTSLATKAQTDLEARKTTGKVLLEP